jgi:hypothetical protein
MEVIIELILSLFFDRAGRRARRRRSNPATVRLLLIMLVGFILLCGICVVIGAVMPGNR